MKIYNKITDLTGKTPLLRLSGIIREENLSTDILAKVEFLNPAGSVKDRVALEMIEDAEKSGVLKSGATIIEPTSGNTGIGLASIGASRGYKIIIVMPDTMSEERRSLISAYGAELVLTDGKIDPVKLRPITYDGMNHTYLVLGEKVGNAFSDGNKLK